MVFCHFSLLLFFRRIEGRGWVNYEYHDRVTFERIFQPGYEYEVSVWKHYVKGSETMGGGHSFEYEFQKVLSKIEVPLLTMDDILWKSSME